MKKVIKWIGIGLAALLIIIAIAVGSLLVVANARINKTYSVQVESLTIPTDAAAIDHGKHIVTTVCTGCHGANLSGQPVMNAPGFAVIYATNLTSGDGGVGKDYKDEDWVRAIRHGVDPDGKSLFLMPSPELYYLSDADLAAVIAYIKFVPPVDHQVPDVNFSVIAKILLATGSLNSLEVASAIDQNAPRPTAPQPGVNAAYGHYLEETHICQNCHGPNLAGGKNPDPNGPPVKNITPGGDLGHWSEADFVNAIRTGALPDGKTLNTAMPWKIYGGLTDDELKAIWLYLQSIPAVTP